jgi:hypothetical protein
MNVKQMMGGTVVQTFFLAAFVSVFATSAQADIAVGFNSGLGDLTNNFWNSRGKAAEFTWQSGGHVRYDPSGASRDNCIYDPKPGHDATQSLYVFGGGSSKEVYAVDFLLDDGKEGVGLLARVLGTSTGTNGYGVKFGTDPGSRVLNLYRVTTTDFGGATTLLTNRTLTGSSLLATQIWYRMELTVKNGNGGVALSAAVINRTNNLVAGSILTYTDNTVSNIVSGGRTGFRVETANPSTFVEIDNFSAVVVPDPPGGTLVAIR